MTLSSRKLALGAAVVALLVVALANAHLVYVSLQSQPECVTHSKPGTVGEHGTYSAARSSC